MARKIAETITDLFARVSFRPPIALFAITSAFIAALTAPGHAVPAYGRITGSVRVVAPYGIPLRSGDYPSRHVNRQAPGAPEIANVVIFVKDAPVEHDLPATRASISQQAESFVPRVTAITRASTVEFPNFDPYFHNVFSLSRAATFDLGRFRNGDTRERTFPRAGVVKVYCHIHSEMSATIMVFDHHLYTTPGADGAFAIDAVPPGSYLLSAWHERIGETTRPVTVTPGEAASVEFALPVLEK
jgi:plastocyanin